MVTGAGLTTTTNFVYEGLTLKGLSATQSGSSATDWELFYFYDENGDPYGGVYRSPGDSGASIIFGMVVTDRGDVVELLDAAGNPFAAYRYDAWGNPLGEGNVDTGIWAQSTSLITTQQAVDIAKRQVLRYASYCFDSESGLYYLSARHYDPETRQFLSKDLSRNDGEESAYQYCGGDPVQNVDPTGYWKWPKVNWKKATVWALKGAAWAAENVTRAAKFTPITFVAGAAAGTAAGGLFRSLAERVEKGSWNKVRWGRNFATAAVNSTIGHAVEPLGNKVKGVSNVAMTKTMTKTKFQRTAKLAKFGLKHYFSATVTYPAKQASKAVIYRKSYKPWGSSF